jgi:hypothetical protein
MRRLWREVVCEEIRGTASIKFVAHPRQSLEIPACKPRRVLPFIRSKSSRGPSQLRALVWRSNKEPHHAVTAIPSNS